MIHRTKLVVFFVLLSFFLILTSSPLTAEAAKNRAKCSLNLSSTPSSTSLQAGGSVTYRYSLKNVGTTSCAGAGVSIYYAANEDYVASSPAPTASDYYWFVGNMARNQVYSFSVTIKNNSNAGDQMFGEACASATGAKDSCVSKAVTLISANAIEPVVPVVEIDPIAPVSTTTLPLVAAGDTQAWIYPGEPACSSTKEYTDGRNIDTLKPEYYTVQSTGALRQLTVSSDGCNAYSPANAADIKAHSNHQYVTVSGSIANFRKLLASSALRTSAINTLTDFTVASGFSGVEIDWENFSDWTATDYANYRNFTTALQASLHAQGKLLMIDAPAISDPTYQSYFLFKYEDFTAIDYIAIMAYDYQYDFGVGEPVAPEAWVAKVVNWAKARLDINRIIVGIPAYGYHGTLGSYNPIIDTYSQSMTYPGFSTRTLSADGEETWQVGNTYYSVQAASTLDRKKALIEAMGIKNVSVWHIGGNLWFSR
ncbi:MAG: glycosyl hydrolase family 18 protein [Patescibacteria group bacterium]